MGVHRIRLDWGHFHSYRGYCGIFSGLIQNKRHQTSVIGYWGYCYVTPLIGLWIIKEAKSNFYSQCLDSFAQARSGGPVESSMADHYILVSSASVMSEEHGCPRSQNANHSFETRRLSMLPSNSPCVSCWAWPLPPAECRLIHLSGISRPPFSPHPLIAFTMYVPRVKHSSTGVRFFVTFLPQSPRRC